MQLLFPYSVKIRYCCFFYRNSTGVPLWKLSYWQLIAPLSKQTQLLFPYGKSAIVPPSIDVHLLWLYGNSTIVALPVVQTV